MMAASGAPQVTPSTMPQRISGVSGSFRCVASLPPGARRAMKACKASTEIDSPAGRPSIVQPIASACDCPKTVVRRFSPKVVFMLKSKKMF